MPRPMWEGYGALGELGEEQHSSSNAAFPLKGAWVQVLVAKALSMWETWLLALTLGQLLWPFGE